MKISLLFVSNDDKFIILVLSKVNIFVLIAAKTQYGSKFSQLCPSEKLAKINLKYTFSSLSVRARVFSRKGKPVTECPSHLVNGIIKE